MSLQFVKFFKKISAVYKVLLELLEKIASISIEKLFNILDIKLASL
jgi:hypothetical protein